MGECARCGAFTDRATEKDYQYCEDCQSHFDDVRRRGVVVEQVERDGSYDVRVTSSRHGDHGGSEMEQVDALARGRHLAGDLGLPAMFEYRKTGSQWDLDAYLNAHPGIRRDVSDRLARVPEDSSNSLIARLRSFF